MSISFDLPAPSGEAVPIFANARDCALWVEALPLANPATAQAQLRAQIALLPNAGLSPAMLFEILEAMRGAVLQVQADMARKFCFRPLPLADFEAGARTATLDLWRNFGICWQTCVQSVANAAPDVVPHAATLCQRALDVQGRLIIDTLHAGSDVAGADWLLLHKLLRVAEEVGVLAEEVGDAHLSATASTHCAATYARPILLALGGPADWGQRQAEAIARWSERLTSKVSIDKVPPTTPGKPPVLVDLSTPRGGFRPDSPSATAAGGDLRYLDINELTKAVRNRVVALRRGKTPASLGLGDEIKMPAAEHALFGLYKHWGDERTGREQQRRASSGSALVASGVPAIHYYVSGRPFRQPGHASEFSAKQRQEIATFGRIATRDDDDHSQTQGFTLEGWIMQDESVAGLRLARAAGASGNRLAPGSLIATRPSDARAFILGVVRWAQVQVNGDLMIGVKTLPGAPQAVALKATGVNATVAKYQQGLLLPAVPALKAAPGVLLPAGWFKPASVLEVRTDDRQSRIKLDALVARGGEFDYCTYSPE